MDSELEKYKEKIKSYTVEELEEILISLNKEKFPEKYELVRNFLAEKNTGSDVFALQQEKKSEAESNFQKIEEISNASEMNKETETFIQNEPKSVKSLSSKQTDSISDQIVHSSELILGLLTIITSVVAVYILLASTFNLPGKGLIVETGKKLPGVSSIVQEAKE
jgi:hypothetical protein